MDRESARSVTGYLLSMVIFDDEKEEDPPFCCCLLPPNILMNICVCVFSAFVV